MAAVSIRNLDDATKERLRVRAARNGRSLEAEIRAILDEAVMPDEEHHMGRALLDLGAEHGGVDLDHPSRREAPRGADLSA